MTIASEAQFAYRWCPLELAPENDFVGFAGDRMIRRIFLEARPRLNGLWHWSSVIGSDASLEVLRQGYAASAQLAIDAVQASYENAIGIGLVSGSDDRANESHIDHRDLISPS
jgi:hypothetical protein